MEISSATTACDLTEVLKQGQSFLGMWLSLLTRLKSTAQHSNSSLMCIVGSSCCFCEVLKKKINTKQSSYMFHSKKSCFFYHCPSQSITTYIFCRVNFHVFWTGIVINWTTELEGTLSTKLSKTDRKMLPLWRLNSAIWIFGWRTVVQFPLLFWLICIT